jgi:hypothetical protein
MWLLLENGLDLKAHFIHCSPSDLGQISQLLYFNMEIKICLPFNQNCLATIPNKVKKLNIIKIYFWLKSQKRINSKHKVSYRYRIKTLQKLLFYVHKKLEDIIGKIFIYNNNKED